MRPSIVKPANFAKGKIVLLGDKSIAHRAAILSAISRGKTTIENFPPNKDCLFTIRVLKRLGVNFKIQGVGNLSRIASISGRGLKGLRKPSSSIFSGDSGTTFRLILGVLAGQNFKARLTAGGSLTKRPMLRVTEPLRKMGADIEARQKRIGVKLEEFPPISIAGGNLSAIKYCLKVASAQVKSAILLAGLFAKGSTAVIEPIKTRDHTERMLKSFKAGIKVSGNTIVIKGNRELISPRKIYIPADISSASFFMVLASILPGSRILIKKVGINPSRAGIIRVLKRMGASIEIRSRKPKDRNFEPTGDLCVRSSKLKGITIRVKEIPSLIDELPVLMVAACFAKGRSVFEGVDELRAKETDRIRSMVENLRKMGAKIRVARAGKREKLVICGVKRLRGSYLKSFGDHRTAMSMFIAALAAEGNSKIDEIECIGKSFPNFLTCLKGILH